MTHVTCRLTAKNPDQLRNPTLGNQVWATILFTLLPCYVASRAYSAKKRPIVTDVTWSGGLSVCLPVSLSVCVCLLDITVCATEAAEPIEIIAVWYVDSGVPNEPCIKLGPESLSWKGNLGAPLRCGRS